MRIEMELLLLLLGSALLAVAGVLIMNQVHVVAGAVLLTATVVVLAFELRHHVRAELDEDGRGR
jgi:Ca2+/Na+ antiporter